MLRHYVKRGRPGRLLLVIALAWRHRRRFPRHSLLTRNERLSPCVANSEAGPIEQIQSLLYKLTFPFYFCSPCCRWMLTSQSEKFSYCLFSRLLILLVRLRCIFQTLFF